MNVPRLIKRLVPAIVLAGGLAAVGAARHAPPSPQASVHTQSQTTSAASDPVSTPRITVNGKNVPVDANGNADVSLPADHARIQVYGGRTTVTTNEPASGSSTFVSENGNVGINVHADSTGGSSHSSMHITSTETTRNGNSHSTSTTHVFSTGSANVQTVP
jgi:hypothetical protein